MAAPLLFVKDKLKYFDTRQPRGGLLTRERAADRLRQYDDKYHDPHILEQTLDDLLLNPVTSNDLLQYKQAQKDAKNGPNLQEIWEEMRELVPIYQRVNAAGQSQAFFVNAQNEAVKLDYETVDNLVASLLNNAEVWSNLTDFYNTSALTEPLKGKLSLGLLLKRMLNEIWPYDSDRILREDIQNISWHSEQIAYKKFDETCLMPGTTPTWDEFTSRLDYPGVFKAWVWSIFEPRNNIRQIMWLKGQGNDGKSSVQRAIEAVIGTNYCYSLKSGDEKDKWFQRNVFGKVLVNYADCRNIYLVSENSIKQLTGGDTTSIEGKGENSFTGKIYAKVLVTSNYAPKINLELQAETSRLIKLDVAPQVDDKKDAQFTQRLQDEFYAFLCQCRDEYAQYISKGGERLELPTELVAKINSDCASEAYLNLEDFLQDYIEFVPGEMCKPSELNTVLKDFLTIEKRVIGSDSLKYYKTDLDAKLNMRGCIQMRQGEAGQQQTMWVGFRLKKHLTNSQA